MKKRWVCWSMAVVLLVTTLTLSLIWRQLDGNSAPYPIDSTVELTYWIPTVGESHLFPALFNDRPFAQELRKKTGIQVTFLQPQISQAHEAFQKMIATNNLPDIIEYKWEQYPGGVRKALEDGTILDLRPFMNKELRDYGAYLDENPEGKKAIYLDTGECPLVCQIDNIDSVYYGPIVRQDWLDALSLPLPETIDEWEEMLLGFQREFHASKPLSISFNEFESHALIGAYGVTRSLYQENGTVKFGPLEEGYLSFLQRMHKWFEKGLLDTNFAACDLRTTEYNILEESSGATWGYLSASLPLYDKKLKESNPNAALVPTVPPSLVKGEPAKISFKPSIINPTGTAITKNCAMPSLAAQFLNFGFTEEGSVTYTYGIEGTSYVRTSDGYQYTDEILHNPTYTVSQMLEEFTRNGRNTPARIDPSATEQYITMQVQKDGQKRWNRTQAAQYLLPPLTPTSQESLLISQKMPALTSIEQSFFVRSIIDGVDETSVQAFYQALQQAGVLEVVSAYQAMYDRYVQ